MKNLDISKSNHKKDIVYLKAILNEHDIIHCLNRLDSPIAELSVLAFTIAKVFAGVFSILLASFLLSKKILSAVCNTRPLLF